ncbi:tripartite tricarboxylate transporter permease [Blastococcus saxobsidens]|uniref:TctA family transporter n=1 Tax=Blastococcus saxobsidens TaxID=138336 RepID=A0A4Q7YA82_9ACTN|nr:tripartite tricarboxylate transporter permease [Blastococcus saxobsidens]RZU33464.1 TctA family transporter [Blastococcus saxobsidens]
MIDGLLGAVSVLMAWPNPVLLVAGVLFGMLIGFLPGMAGSVALALLIPISFTMDPEDAVLFLIAAYSPAGFGGMLTSILVNTPGSPENAATTFDGYPMAKQGRAGAAIGAATAASVLGGLFGTAVLLALIPPAQSLVLSFSYPEFLMMAILGLTVIAVITDRNTFKGLAAAAVGFLLAFVGLEPITGSPRFTFDQFYLWDGVNIVPVLIGLFAGAEVLALFGKGTSIAEQGAADTHVARVLADKSEPVTFWEGVRVTFRHWFLVIRASIIGTVIGVIPGVGGAVSGFLAYSHAKQSSRTPERFGKGAVEGVIAAESANDAKEGGSLLPTVAFGIPGTVGMAILLGALIMQGIPAGPTLMIEHIDLVYTLVIGMVAAKFVAPIVVYAVARYATKLTALRPGLFTPLIAVAALVGSYTIGLEILDVVVALVFGYVGYAMRRYGFSRVALIIALVLGELVERSYYQMVATFGSPMPLLTRPISAVLVTVCALVLLFAAWQAYRRARSAERASVEGEDDEELASAPRQPGRIIFDALLLVFSAAIVVQAFDIENEAATMPLLIGIPVVGALTLQLFLDALPGAAVRIRSTLVSVTGGRRQRAVSAPSPDPVTVDPAAATTGHTSVLEEARTRTQAAELAAEQEEEQEMSGRQVLLRQTAFGLWAVGFVALAWLVGFVVAIPVALLFFLRLLARESWLRSVLVTLGSWAFLYGLFVVLLDVPL